MILSPIFISLVLVQSVFCSEENKSTLSIDDFFNYTHYPLVAFSPTGNHVLVRMKRPVWQSNRFENSLWVFNSNGQQKDLITRQLSLSFRPHWSPSGNWIVLSLTNSTSNIDGENYIYLYSIQRKQLLNLKIGKTLPSAITWSNDDSVLYFSTFESWSTDEEKLAYDNEWGDAIVYRRTIPKQGSVFYRLHVSIDTNVVTTKIHKLTNVTTIVTDLIYAPAEEKLFYTSADETLEKVDRFELYSIDLRNELFVQRITYNEALEQDLQLSHDGNYLMFQIFTFSSNTGGFHNTQQRLYALNLRTQEIIRLAEDFTGSIAGYTMDHSGALFILGLKGTEIQIYSKTSFNSKLIKHHGWSGSYESISISKSPKQNCAIAFVYSSSQSPKEIYCVKHTDSFHSATAITHENKILTERILPSTKVYRWKNSVDNRTIEGLLHYPPEYSHDKTYPLLVLLHGGPYDASLNHLQGDGYAWAPLAATDGWLVLEPNYRGSIGYGEEFVREIRFEPFRRAGQDILDGIDKLIQDGIADSVRLAIGGYSFGGLLTNWLITQTTRFNAAVSGTGVIDPTSTWGTMDLPVAISYVLGGFPWEIPDSFQDMAAIYRLNKVRTPTHIVTGDRDIRVPPSQSYMLERGLHNIGIPVQLLIFPGEGHSVINSRKPSFGKIKVREELKWLKQYGHKRWNISIA